MPLAHVEQQLFRRACSKYATGVTILTVRDERGSPQGMTANSFTSVSLAPPMILVCVDLRTPLLSHCGVGTHFGINVLRQDQAELSTRFAQSGCDRFEGVEWRAGETGVPVLPGMLATLECAVSQIVAAGDHAILIGEVLHASWQDGQPLVYFNSSYQALRMVGSP